MILGIYNNTAMDIRKRNLLLKSESHPPKKFVLFASLKALQK